jgi:DNA-directed RNA polymerase subunit omega
VNSKLLEAALQKTTNPEVLINVVSRRVRQLNQGHRPLVQVDGRMDNSDIALKEIVEGKLDFELPPAEEAPSPRSKKKK